MPAKKKTRKKKKQITLGQLLCIIHDTVDKILEEKLAACSREDVCPVCNDDGYIIDPITRNRVACFCRVGMGVLCVKNPPDLFA